MTADWQPPDEVLRLPPACELPSEELEQRRQIFVIKHDGSSMRNPGGKFLDELQSYVRLERGKLVSGNVVPFKPTAEPRWQVPDVLRFADRAVSMVRFGLEDAGQDPLTHDEAKDLRSLGISIANGAEVKFGLERWSFTDAVDLVLSLEPDLKIRAKPVYAPNGRRLSRVAW